MKKKLSILTIASLSLFSSCSNSDTNVDDNIIQSRTISNSQSAKFGDLTEDELVKELSTDQDFIQYGMTIFSLFENMPNKDYFRTNFNQADFEKEKEVYFTQLTGYSNNEVSVALDKMNDLLGALYNKYPQLRYNGENQEFIERVIEKADFIVEQNLASNGKGDPACQACVKKWKPRMIAATVIGGVVGGASGGFFGAWGGAVIGFVGAGWGAVDCLEAAGC
ncbi:hypothetical protein [Chryseobacterium camelliae]|uniref:hypothetical protein n=1 Tax=Chryseobacterium camelliae TaxID=1265445 RepID=UPI002857791C|nr:hypothetical protein [Chryseobacterium camelliae]MDR6515605.1 outer membrane lipoprotein SlyB [Chryseobacterium camelliae]